MPVMDGIECVREIRRLEKYGTLPGHLKVIAVTANVRGEHVRRAEDAGMVREINAGFVNAFGAKVRLRMGLL